MWHAPANNLAITGGTVVNSPHATFLNKGQQLVVTVDGSKGARLNPGDGIIVQVMDNDDPGPVMVNGVLENAGVYTSPAGEPARDTAFNVTTAHEGDSVLSFTGIELAGDFYNGMRADLNVIDFDTLRCQRPFMAYDLPSGGKRLLQRAKGYDATVVAGQVIARHDEPTGATPGRLVRGPQADPRLTRSA